jgi:serine/threonine-protein kinase PknK
LVTLTGFGGVGKTRLAMRVVTDMRRAVRDGVVFVPLSTVVDPGWVTQTIIDAIGLCDMSTKDQTVPLVEYLQPRDTLLVIDNCEHLVDAVARLVDRLMVSCPRLRVLATSREALRIQGELVYVVAPLGVPPEEDVEGSLFQYDAVELFVERAHTVVPDFAFTDASRTLVAALCRRLEGMPLAIELATGRLRTMSLAELSAHLTDRWELLGRGGRTAPDRQQTMAACIEWSYELCTEVEREVWGRASVFSEGFEREALTAVCADEAGSEHFIDALSALVEKSVIETRADEDRTWFRMLPPLAERGLVRLREQGQLDEVRRRHRDWYADLAARAWKDWVSQRQMMWVWRLRRAWPNLRIALDFCCVQPGEADVGAQMAVDLLEFLTGEGLIRAGRLWADRLLSTPALSQKARVQALIAACWFAALQGDTQRASRLLDDAYQLATPMPDEQLRALVDQAGSLVSLSADDLPRSIELARTALEVFERVGEPAQVARTLGMLATFHTLNGEQDAALDDHHACLAITEPVGEAWFQSYSLWLAGLALWRGGDDAGAIEALKQSLGLKRSLGGRLGIGMALEALACVHAVGDAERALTLLASAQNEWDLMEWSTEPLHGLSAQREECRRVVRSRLSDRAYQAAWDRGRALDEQAAIGFALEETASARPTSRAMAAELGVLTRRQREVAGLVAQGMTNKEIARALVVSQRTAEAHVENILSRLGFTTRGQISTWIADQRPSGD